MAAAAPTKLNYNQLVEIARAQGFQGNAAYIIAAIAMAESAGHPDWTNCKNNTPAGSCDRGILQINNYWHREISDACAYNPTCAFGAAFSISKGGTNFTPWVTYTKGWYLSFLPKGVAASPPPPPTGGYPGGVVSPPISQGVGSVPIDTAGLSWTSALQVAAQWVGNPVRILKIVAGLAMVITALILAFLPEAAGATVAAAGFPQYAEAARQAARGRAHGAVGEALRAKRAPAVQAREDIQRAKITRDLQQRQVVKAQQRAARTRILPESRFTSEPEAAVRPEPTEGTKHTARPRKERKTFVQPLPQVGETTTQEPAPQGGLFWRRGQGTREAPTLWQRITRQPSTEAQAALAREQRGKREAAATRQARQAMASTTLEEDLASLARKPTPRTGTRPGQLVGNLTPSQRETERAELTHQLKLYQRQLSSYRGTRTEFGPGPEIDLLIANTLNDISRTRAALRSLGK